MSRYQTYMFEWHLGTFLMCRHLGTLLAPCAGYRWDVSFDQSFKNVPNDHPCFRNLFATMRLFATLVTAHDASLALQFSRTVAAAPCPNQGRPLMKNTSCC